MLMSTGLTRPPDQLEYWNSLIHKAIKGGITFYAVDVHGLDNDTGSNSKLGCTTPQIRRAEQRPEFSRTGRWTRDGPSGPGRQHRRITGRADHGIDASDRLTYGSRVLSANTQEALRELAESTGGFIIANTNNTDKIARVMEDVDTHYEISYRPASDREDGHFRKIEVKLAKADLRVQTRSGYFAVPDRPGDPLTGADMAGLRALDTKPLHMPSTSNPVLCIFAPATDSRNTRSPSRSR